MPNSLGLAGTALIFVKECHPKGPLHALTIFTINGSHLRIQITGFSLIIRHHRSGNKTSPRTGILGKEPPKLPIKFASKLSQIDTFFFFLKILNPQQNARFLHSKFKTPPTDMFPHGFFWCLCPLSARSKRTRVSRRNMLARFCGEATA